MAGKNAAFDARLFRDSIHTAMKMGMSPEIERQPVFHFPEQVSPVNEFDSGDVPLDPGVAMPTEPAAPPVSVPCGIEYGDTAGEMTNLGVVSPTRLVLTLLDVDYRKVEGFAYVVIDGDRYNYRRIEPPRGLFDVGIFRIHCIAEDES
jgi:hypothetical protein